MGGARREDLPSQHGGCRQLRVYSAKLAARIEAKSRTFLIKVKAHRGEPLNEGADDLAEAGHEMEKEGENSRWRERTTRVVYPYYDR